MTRFNLPGEPIKGGRIYYFEHLKTYKLIICCRFKFVIFMQKWRVVLVHIAEIILLT